MKKNKNITLLIGMACIASIVPWSLVRSIIYIFNDLESSVWVRFFVNNTLIVSLTAPVLLILPTIVFVRNIKHQSIRWSSIASVVINGAFLCYELYITINAFRQLHPAFLIVNDAAMRRVHLDQLMHIVKSGQLLLIIGCIFVIVGSSLFLCKAKTPHSS